MVVAARSLWVNSATGDPIVRLDFGDKWSVVTLGCIVGVHCCTRRDGT